MRKRGITRRDFINGIGVAAGSTALPLPFGHAWATDGKSVYYPPVLTGLRGSHDGAWEVAHALRDGSAFRGPENRDAIYDLIVVGGGISGLSAAWFYRKQVDPDARILIIDNHDDFGGHAKRNEFWQDGRMYLLNGGTLNVEAPSQYSAVAAGLLWELGIDRTRYYEAIAPAKDRYKNLGMSGGVFFDRKTFGGEKLVAGFGERPYEEFFDETPMSPKARADAIRLFTAERDYLPGVPPEQKRDRLMRMSYRDYVVDVIGCEPEVAALFDPDVNSLFAVGTDAIPALYGREMGFPGFAGMDLPETPPGLLVNEPGGQHGRENNARAQSGDADMYFPDGNATITRLLVSSLVPGSIPASTMEGIITARADYSRLDREDARVRIRLNSTAIRVEHTGDDEVAVTYVRGDDVERVRGRATVLACWHSVIPHICPELPDRQRTALGDGEKSPVVYTSVLLSNWRCFVDAGVRHIACPGGYHTNLSLGTPLVLGDYRSSESPDQPIVLGMGRYPCQPGLSRREQHRAGRTDLLATTFETFETEIRAQLDATFSAHGFDAEKDILAITVNRWPHGYTYSYNPLFDPVEWAYTTTDERPNVIARQRHGRIAIANADAAASPHTDAAINEAWRAVSELMSVL
ncbi:MAG TPA: NAD(P)-binding protein [Woeseiaceae bacterium]|nr:NAD(P)-binding protein [Woeseiaceae bacterium]